MDRREKPDDCGCIMSARAERVGMPRASRDSCKGVGRDHGAGGNFEGKEGQEDHTNNFPIC